MKPRTRNLGVTILLFMGLTSACRKNQIENEDTSNSNKAAPTKTESHDAHTDLPNRVVELLAKINDWDKTEIEMCLNIERAMKANYLTSGRTGSIVNDIGTELWGLGYKLEWSDTLHRAIVNRVKDGEENPWVYEEFVPTK